MKKKMIEVSEDFYNAALELASYIHEIEHDNYTEFLREGNESEDHIYHQASIINNDDDSATILELLEVDFNKTMDRIL